MKKNRLENTLWSKQPFFGGVVATSPPQFYLEGAYVKYDFSIYLDIKRQVGDQISARCPFHDDRM